MQEKEAFQLLPLIRHRCISWLACFCFLATELNMCVLYPDISPVCQGQVHQLPLDASDQSLFGDSGLINITVTAVKATILSRHAHFILSLLQTSLPYPYCCFHIYI